MHRIAVCLLVPLLLGARLALAEPETSAAAPVPPSAAHGEALLAALHGDWTMRGDVMGKPVVYTLAAQPVLGGSFVELHMKDVQVPAQYEARVFIGRDPESGTVIAHWLDSFGAKYSIPHGSGRIEGERIAFEIPYPDGSFRDVLEFDRARGSWSLTIDAQQPAGGWAHFARYAITR